MQENCTFLSFYAFFDEKHTIYLVISEKSSTFAADFEKKEVNNSNSQIANVFVIWRGESSGGYKFSGATQKRISAPEELSTMSNGIKAITSDFGSEDLGSIPGWTTKGDSRESPFCFNTIHMRQG